MSISPVSRQPSETQTRTPKRFDLLVLRRQLAQLDGDAVAAERVRETVQAIAAVLLPEKNIPSVAERLSLLDEVASTANGAMEPRRLYESPYTDHRHPDLIFPEDLDVIVEILREVERHAMPSGAA